jgi:hypothetical protein
VFLKCIVFSVSGIMASLPANGYMVHFMSSI